MAQARYYGRRVAAAPYSPAEDAIICAGEAAGRTRAAIAADLREAGFPRNPESVAVRARMLARERRARGDAPLSAGPRDRMPRTWAPEHLHLLRDLAAAGETGSAIAARLCAAGREGTTRNAVLGQVDRLGLRLGAGRAAAKARAVERRQPAPVPPAERPRPEASPARERRAPAVRPGTVGDAKPPVPRRDAAFPAIAAAAPMPAQPVPPAGGVPFLSVGATGCRFPLAGQGAGMLVCGGAAAPGRPYCPAHMARAYVPAPARPPRPAWERHSAAPARAPREPDLVEMVASGEGA